MNAATFAAPSTKTADSPRRQRRHAGERDRAGERVRAVVDLPAGQVDRGRAGVGQLPPVGSVGRVVVAPRGDLGDRDARRRRRAGDAAGRADLGAGGEGAVDAVGRQRGDRRQRVDRAAVAGGVVEADAGGRGAVSDAGDAVAVGGVDVDLVTAAAEPDARAAVGAELDAGRRAARPPGGREGVDLGRVAVDEDGRLARCQRADAGQRDGRGEGVRVVVDLPAGQVGRLLAGVGQLEPVGRVARVAAPRRDLGDDDRRRVDRSVDPQRRRVVAAAGLVDDVERAVVVHRDALVRLVGDRQPVARVAPQRQRAEDGAGAVGLDDLARLLADHQQVVGVGAGQPAQVRERVGVGEVGEAEQRRVEQVDRVLGQRAAVGGGAGGEVDPGLEDAERLLLLDGDEAAAARVVRDPLDADVADRRAERDALDVGAREACRPRRT